MMCITKGGAMVTGLKGNYLLTLNQGGLDRTGCGEGQPCLGTSSLRGQVPLGYFK